MTGFDSKRDMAADKLQEREALNVSAIVFVYRHYKDKTIKAEYYSEAKLLDDSADWEHIATLNPRMWIEFHYAEVEALAQPAQEPVALNKSGIQKLLKQSGYDNANPEEKAAFISGIRHREAEMLDTTPPQRQPLTDEKLFSIINPSETEQNKNDFVDPVGGSYGITYQHLVRFARAIEAAHGIKEKT